MKTKQIRTNRSVRGMAVSLTVVSTMVFLAAAASDYEAEVPLSEGTQTAILPAGARPATMPPIEMRNSAPESSRIADDHDVAEERVDTIYTPLFPTDTTESDVISLSLQDVPVVDVVNMFARTIADANIVFGSNVLIGTVSVSLKDVLWEDALDVILDTVDLAKVHGRGGIYRIIPKSELETAPLESVVYVLKYSRAEDILPVAREMCTTPGSGVFAAPGNVIVVRETADRAARIVEAVTKIDRPREQVFIEAKFVELNADARENIGIDWSILEGYRIGLEGMEWGWMDQRERSRRRDDRGYQYDVFGDHRGQYRFMDESGQRIPGTGVEFDSWGTRPDPSGPVTDRRWDGSPARYGLSEHGRGRSIESTVQDTYERTFAEVKSAILSPMDFSLVLSALRQDEGVQVVSNPKIIVLNEETAKIDIGTREPNIFTETVYQENVPPRTISRLDRDEPYFQFGISLEVTPTINTESNIAVRIEPTLTRFVSDKIGPDGNTFPIRSTKTIQTLFNLASGRTVAIGGLTEVDNRDVEKKVPVLGSIPVLGRLFSHKSSQHQQAETIIFVTVALARSDAIAMREGLPGEAQLTRRYMREHETETQIRDREFELFDMQEELRLREEMERYRQYLEKLRRRIEE